MRLEHTRIICTFARIAACGALFAILAIPPSLVRAAAGDLDPTFNATGKVMTKIGSGIDDARAVAIQTDGRIVVAGSSWTGSQYAFVVTRYNVDGTLDPTFGVGGKVATGGPADGATAMALQADGKIVVAGY